MTTPEQAATTLIVEAAGKSITVALGQPMTLRELWDHFTFPGRRRPVCTMSGGTARVTF